MVSMVSHGQHGQPWRRLVSLVPSAGEFSRVHSFLLLVDNSKEKETERGPDGGEIPK